MADLIERATAIAIIEEKQKELCPMGMFSRHKIYGTDREKFDNWQEIIDQLDAIPCADAEPVIRCKDCRYSSLDEEYGHRWCNRGLGCREVEFDGDGFCSYGERRADG